MKRFLTPAETPSANRIAVLLAATLILTTSCIYDAPNDRFYRTLWVCEEAPLESLTVEFLCGGSVSAIAPHAIGSYGTYDTQGNTAYFIDLRLSNYSDSAPRTIILEEAHRSNDQLLLCWHYSDSPVSYTTHLVRKGSYD